MGALSLPPLCFPYLRLLRLLSSSLSSSTPSYSLKRLRQMEVRMRRNGGQVSPERCIVWTEPSGKNRMQRQQGRKVPVVYYLCKNSLLEHPHFIEVPFSSPEGLYLRDVINRLVVLRGNHMPTMYSWSSKRSYRNGFVWQDLAEDDLIIPAQGNDYILKGSLLLNEGSADALSKSNSKPGLQKNRAHRQTEHSLCSRNEEVSPSLSPITTMREMKPLPLTLLASSHQLVDDRSLPSQCRVLMPSGALNASGRTEDGAGKKEYEPSTQTTCVLTDNELSDANFNEMQLKDVQTNDGMKDGTPQIPMPWNAGMGTLVSLIRAEVEKLDSFKVSEENGVHQSKVKIKRTNALFQLISCGSILKKINMP